MPPTTVIARNLRSALSSYARSTREGEVSDLHSAVLVNSGINYAVFNATVLSEPLRSSSGELQDLLRSAGDFYGSRNMEWSCWVCEDLLDGGLGRDLPDLVERHGLRLVAEHRAMFAPRIAPPQRALPYLDYRPVGDFDTRLDFIHISKNVFGLPGHIAQAIYGSQEFWTARLSGWIGYAAGRPVCSAATDTAEGVVGVYSVATLPEQRRRGYGEAVTRHAIEQARLSSGATASILQSTRAGLPLYRKMGYEPLGRLSVFATR